MALPGLGSQARVTLPCPWADAVSAAAMSVAPKHLQRPRRLDSTPKASLARPIGHTWFGRQPRIRREEQRSCGSGATARIALGSGHKLMPPSFTRRERLARLGRFLIPLGNPLLRSQIRAPRSCCLNLHGRGKQALDRSMFERQWVKIPAQSAPLASSQGGPNQPRNVEHVEALHQLRAVAVQSLGACFQDKLGLR